ncbi:MAG TPA: MFS transporter [Bacillota bacterium]|nr:MFS transporter [Bacillota bacterium]HPU74596.1 MFS transporter [Bacillota bacterium]
MIVFVVSAHVRRILGPTSAMLQAWSAGCDSGAGSCRAGMEMDVGRLKANALSQAIHFFSRQPRDWKVTACRASVDKLLYQMVFPYLSVYIALLGATGTQLGVVNSTGMAAGAVLGLVSAAAANSLGTKRVYVIGVALVGLSYLVTGLASSWVVALMGTMIWWCGSTVAGHSCGIVCGSSLLNKDRATAMGCCESLAQGVMGLIGPVIGAILVTRFGGVSTQGIRPLFLIASALSLVSLLLISTKLSQTEYVAYEKAGFRAGIRPLLLLGERPDLWRFVAVSCLANLPTGMVLPFTQVFAREVKMADQYVLGAMVTAFAVVGLLLGVPLGRLADRFGRKRILYALAPVFWASNLLLVWSARPVLLILAGVLQGTVSMTLVVTQAMAFELVPSSRVSDWLAVLRFFRMLVGAALAFISGLVWDHFGPEYVFLLAVAIDAAVRIPLLAGLPETLDADA